MKHIIPISLALAIPAFGGAPVSVAPAPTASSPTLTQWFLGASYGQLDGVDTGLENVLIIGDGGEVDFDLFNLQFGRTLGCFGGFDTAAYLEVGYGTGESGSIPYQYDDVPPFPPIMAYADVDLEMIPVTINFALERRLVGGLGCYITAGVGYAFTQATMDFNGGYNDVDENDGGFYAQATAGLSYNFTEAFEIFGGIRWSYLDGVEWADELSLSDTNAWGWEVGLRYNF